MMIFLFSLLDTVRAGLIHMAPGMPPSCWVITAFILGALALAALIDIFAEIVPDALIFLGLLTVIGTQGVFGAWDLAAYHMFQAVVAGMLIWSINAIWYRLFRHDALGMGDAKWTMLAVACFGVMPSVIAWGVGSVLAIVFIGVLRLSRRKAARVTFVPFLFIGLCAGLYLMRFSPFTHWRDAGF
jgi:prepilin signal peptidase PulO-like enzyme (type II secretory pathway)